MKRLATKLSLQRARAFCQALKADTGSRAMHWRGITPIAKRAGLEDPAAAVATAVEQGWLEVEDGHSVMLTQAGRRLT